MRRLVLAAALALAACANGAPPPPPNLPAAPIRVPAPPPPPVSLPAAPISVPKPPPPDQCGASELFALVGKPRTAIPVPIDPTRRRVVCTTCPRTFDYRPDRLTIEYDVETGVVTKVSCG
jgi:hypothetical protein